MYFFDNAKFSKWKLFFTDFGINEQNYGFKSRTLVKTRHNFTWKVMYIIFKRGMRIYIKKKKSIYIRQFKNKFCLNKSLCAMIIRILQGISITCILNLFSFSNHLWKINTCIWLRLNSFKPPSNDQIKPLSHI